MKKVLILFVVLAILFISSGCRQAERVSYNISKEADNFNVERRLTVINARSDKPLFELIGRFSISNNTNNELIVTIQTGANEFKKHYVYINKEWTMYVVEDIGGASVDKYKYEINFLPDMIVPITFTMND